MQHFTRDGQPCPGTCADLASDLEDARAQLRDRITAGDKVTYQDEQYTVMTVQLRLDADEQPVVQVQLLTTKAAPISLRVTDGWVPIEEVERETNGD